MALTDDPPARAARKPAVRILAAIGFALAFCLGVYLLIGATQPVSGLVSFSFLLILPAAVSAFVAYVADPWGERSRRFYFMMPVWLLLAIIVASLVILREGVICVLLLSPLWLVSGLIGAWITYASRRRRRDRAGGTTYCSALLLTPLLAMQVEPYVPLPTDTVCVTRSAVIHASPAALWPLLRGIPDVRPGEGTWTLSQDVIGIPRPRGARLIGAGIGADRYADWGHHIRFRERITEWDMYRRIGWRFIFDDIAGWGFTDRHLMPDGPYFRVTRGGYTVEPIGPGLTRVTIDTEYRITTPVNRYSELWGQLFLGDLETNLLALIRGRAERTALSDAPGRAIGTR